LSIRRSIGGFANLARKVVVRRFYRRTTRRPCRDRPPQRWIEPSKQNPTLPILITDYIRKTRAVSLSTASGERPESSGGTRHRSDALRSLHEVVKDLHAVGAIDKATMRDFDLSCLTPAEPLEPDAIKRIREQSHMSQATFALALNVSTILVSKWERGEVRPSGPSLKLLALADKKGIDSIL
jgi:putative transcriptional regulator